MRNYFGGSNRKTALVAGASGLVGKQLVLQLLKSPVYTQVKTIGRRHLPINAPNLEQYIIDFENLEKHRHLLVADDVFCCLGTTIKKAGSKEAFKKVDYQYTYNLAEMCVSLHVRQFLFISSAGANEYSNNFYLRIKAQTERAIKRLPYHSVKIFRPSLLVGKRNEERPGESFAIFFGRMFSFLMFGKWRRYRPIKAETVARAMIKAANNGKEGNITLESERIQQMGK